MTKILYPMSYAREKVHSRDLRSNSMIVTFNFGLKKKPYHFQIALYSVINLSMFLLVYKILANKKMLTNWEITLLLTQDVYIKNEQKKKPSYEHTLRND